MVANRPRRDVMSHDNNTRHVIVRRGKHGVAAGIPPKVPHPVGLTLVYYMVLCVHTSLLLKRQFDRLSRFAWLHSTQTQIDQCDKCA